ncbi:MAG: hypothetical protein KF729_06000 [Sandaracinaceae bacterium]|nr:hypothetical protein [Sandaracinaceae bacterium]
MTGWRNAVFSCALAAVGCGGVSLRVIDGPGGRAAAPTSVAVLGFDSGDADVSGRVGDGCAAGAFRAGVRAVERQRVDAMLRERGLERSGEVGPGWYRQLGELLGVDAFLAGSVRPTEAGNVSNLSGRLIAAGSGSVLRIVDAGQADLISIEPFAIGERACLALLEGR